MIFYAVFQQAVGWVATHRFCCGRERWVGTHPTDVSNIFNFLGLTKTYFDVKTEIPAGWQQLLAGIQSVAGVVFLFFLGLGLRTRFRLH